VVETTQVEGDAAIETGEVPLTHKRLGELAFACGEGTIAAGRALPVVSDSKVTVRMGEGDALPT
jgi:hypothetical protein